MDFLNHLFVSDGFMPHGHCYLWLPSLVWLHAGADLIVGTAYVLIPFTLVWFHRRRPDIPLRWIFLVFAAFIVACGATHLLDVWTLWYPAYWLLGGVKALTAALSLLAAFALIKVAPDIMAIPSPALLRGEVVERHRIESELHALNEELERRVFERTAEVEAANAELKGEIAERVRIEQALRESEERLRTLVQHAPEAIVVLDLRQGSFTLVNDNACRLFGLPREELLLRGPVELSAPVQPDGRDASESAREKLAAALHGETPVFEWMHRDAHGRDVLCEVRLVHLPSSDAPLVRGSIIEITQRKQAEEAQRKSEAKFATVVRTCPESVSFSLWEDGAYVEVNDAYERLFGYPRQEVIGRSAVALGLWVDLSERALLLDRLNREGRVTGFEARFKRKDGAVWIGELSAEATVLDGKRGLVVVMRDITAQKHAAEALRLAEERFSLVFRATPEVLAISTEVDGTFLEVNPAYERVFGFARDEVIGKSSLALNIWVDPEDRVRMMTRLRAEGRVTEMSLRFRRKNGDLCFSQVSVEPIELEGRACLVLAMRDVTERVRVEDALRKSEEKFSKVFRTCPETITIATLHDGIYLDVNEAFERLYGVPRSEAIGSSSLQLGLWVDPGQRNELVRQLEENRRVTGFPNLIRHRSGEIKVSEISAERIDLDGRECLIAVVRDTTDRKRAEDEILRLNAELEQRVRRRTAELEVANQELESFSYSVSHDLRAPLRSVHGFSQALLEDCGAQIGTAGRQHLDRIQAAAQRMGQLIDDLLQLSRVSRTEMVRQPVDLTALAHEVVQDLRTADPQRQVEVAIEEGLRGTGDPRLLRVVLENLLGNAWKFTSRRDAGRIEFGLRPGSGTVFQLRDNGAGFDMAFASKLFGAFQRLHGPKDFPGTGVGLATVHRIIRRHGGSIRADAAVDRGSVFYFTLSEGDEPI